MRSVLAGMLPFLSVWFFKQLLSALSSTSVRNDFAAKIVDVSDSFTVVMMARSTSSFENALPPSLARTFCVSMLTNSRSGLFGPRCLISALRAEVWSASCFALPLSMLELPFRTSELPSRGFPVLRRRATRSCPTVLRLRLRAASALPGGRLDDNARAARGVRICDELAARGRVAGEHACFSPLLRRTNGVALTLLVEALVSLLHVRSD
mmetsp:Transcript_123956/g.214877  ORF Transcript_123956/g.214877 Transcript_123956/m.214877 type:complete len:209 (+) Transcript_123956:570-1196(+)